MAEKGTMACLASSSMVSKQTPHPSFLTASPPPLPFDPQGLVALVFLSLKIGSRVADRTSILDSHSFHSIA